LITFPNCKINIGLHVTEKRSDGFHNIETVLVPAGWQDLLEIICGEKSSAEPEIRCTGIRVYGTRETNLCIRAVRLLSNDFPIPEVRMHLHKLIPVGAGLGGGSSDAAHTLLLLNEILKLSLDENQLEDYAKQLGSDCAFFIKNRPVYATEKGDRFESIRLKLKGIYCVIVKPKVHISTPLAYSWVKPAKPQSALSDLIQLPMTEWKNVIVNDFEKPVFERYPAVKNIKARLYKLGAFYASMSGSGSAVYGLFNEEKHLNTYFRSSNVWSGYLV
jgi:4-diphosphocytidyl-2-C-methyl-D-erythritol kinase